MSAVEETPGDEIYRPPSERRWRRPWQPEFLRSLSAVPDVTSACRAANVSRATAYEWRGNDKEFATAWDEALDQARDLVEKTAHTWITSGVPVLRRHTKTITKRDEEGNVLEQTTTVDETESAERSATLMIFWLKANYPERYRFAERIEHAGTEGSPIEIAVTKEEVDAAADSFSAAVVRLADARAAKEGAG